MILTLYKQSHLSTSTGLPPLNRHGEAAVTLAASTVYLTVDNQYEDCYKFNHLCTCNNQWKGEKFNR